MTFTCIWRSNGLFQSWPLERKELHSRISKKKNTQVFQFCSSFALKNKFWHTHFWVTMTQFETEFCKQPLHSLSVFFFFFQKQNHLCTTLSTVCHLVMRLCGLHFTITYCSQDNASPRNISAEGRWFWCCWLPVRCRALLADTARVSLRHDGAWHKWSVGLFRLLFCGKLCHVVKT